MPIFYPDILDQKTAPRTFTYGDKDVMLYALGVGMGRDPMNETELPFVYEKNLKVIPTAATVLASGGLFLWATRASSARSMRASLSISSRREVSHART